MYTLYIEHGCPFCAKVLHVAEREGIPLTLIDRDQNNNRATLIAQGGKPQVPYLIDSDSNVEMYESDDIIAHLKTKHIR